MKKIFSLIALLTTLCSANTNAQTWQDTQWTEGGEMLVGCQLGKSQVLFVAGGYMDSGYGYLFNIKKTGKDSYDLKGTTKPATMPADKSSIAYDILQHKTFNADATTHWKRREVDGHDLLLRYEDTKCTKLSAIYEQTSREMREVTQDKIMEVYDGKYKDAKGKVYSFSSVDGSCTWAGKQTTWEIDGEVLAPDNVALINDKAYMLILTVKGMDIYEASKDEGQYTRGKFVTSLIADKESPRWAMTSKYVISDYAIARMDKEVLRLMRNEIFARHGYVFKDGSLSRYFKACSWYKPGTDNSKVKLSELETLNVNLLKYYGEK